MRIGIDARFITKLPMRGIGNFSKGIIFELVNQMPDYEILLLSYMSEQ